MAGLIVLAFAIGLTVSGMQLSPAKFKWVTWHKWIGITVLGLAALRLLARLTGHSPALPASMSRAARIAARLGHLALYVLMVAIPLTGWMMSSAYGFPVVYLKLVQLPDLVAPSKPLAETLKGLHATLDWLLAAALLGHVAAALKHQLIDRDGLMRRMVLSRPDR
jgi:cytochrome b561